jgi:hypothetical protein
MAPNSQLKPALLMTMLMLLSIALAPASNWNEDSDDSTSLDAESSEEMTDSQARAVTGEQKVLVIPSMFSDMDEVNNTRDELDDIFNGNFSDFFDEISYGSISVTVDVFDWQELGISWNGSDSNFIYWVDTDKPPDGVDDEWRYDGQNVCQASINALEANTTDAEVDFASYDQVICLVNGPSFRGWAYSPSFGNDFPLTTTTDGNIQIAATVVSERDNNNIPVFWGRIAHEFGHLLGKRHISPDYNHSHALMAALYPGHMTAYKKYDGSPGGVQLDWLPESNIETAVPGTVEEYIIRPLELDVPGDIQAVKIDVSPSIFYMVEVRKYIGADNYSKPSGSNIMRDEGVVIYRVDDLSGEGVTQMDSDTSTSGNRQHDSWDVGDTFSVTEGGKDIQVEVLNTVGNGYNVRVSYDIAGLMPAEISITPWDAPPASTNSKYYTPDIWVDSEINGWDRYRNEENPDVPGDGSGDDPWVDNVNRLWFRVENIGELAAKNVEVKAYYSTPPIAGMNTVNFEFIDSIIIDEIAPQSTHKDYIEWIPTVAGLASTDEIHSLHSCVKIVVTELSDGELSTVDNQAQENIHRFETSSSSPFKPVESLFKVGNPFDYHTIVYASLVDSPDGWDFELEWEKKLIAPNSINLVNLTVTPPASLSPFSTLGVGSEYTFAIRYWIDVAHEGGDITVEPHGGSTLQVLLVEESYIDFDVQFVNQEILVDGDVTSQGYTPQGEDFSGAVVALQYFTPDGVSIVHPVAVNSGSESCTAHFSPGSSIEIVYASPSGQTSTSSRTTDANGEYMDSFTMRDAGNWTVSYTYTDRDGNSHQWQEVIEVVMNQPQAAPIAEGYDKTCGIGVFSDTFSGTADVPLNDGNWNVRVLFAGDSIHRSTMTTNQTVRVEGMPIVHPAVDIDDVFVLEGTLATGVHSDSELVVNYVSPRGIDYRHTLSVDRYNDYYDRIILDEVGVWKIELRYMDVNRESIEWTETVNVIGFDIGPVTTPPVIDRITHEDTIRGDDVTVGGRLNATSATAGTTVTIRAWSPSGVLTTRDVTTDEDLRFENTIEMDESGRWTIEYEYTDDEGNVMSWGEAIDVEDTEEKEIFTYESGVILAAALIILTGLLLVAVGKRNRQDDREV